MAKQKQTKQNTLFVLLIAIIVFILVLPFLYFNSLAPIKTMPSPAPQHAAGGEGEGSKNKLEKSLPQHTRTPEEWAKEKAAWEKLTRLEREPIQMQAGVQDSGWLLLTDEQGHRQGYIDGTEYFDEIPVAYHQIEPVQTYRFTETVPITATIIGKEEGTYYYWQTIGRHSVDLKKVPTRKDAKDNIRFDTDANILSIHFDPAFPERAGNFQFRDSMNYKKNMGKNVAFNGKNIPVIPGATLSFSVDIDVLRAGEKGMTITLDRNSDGQAEQSVQVGGGQLTAEDSRQVDFTPESPEFAELFGTNAASQTKE